MLEQRKPNMSIELAFPEKILRRLDELARQQDALIEEIVTEAVLEYLQFADPETKTALQLNLSEQYLRSAKELIAEADYLQASEKRWAAASQLVKAIAAKRRVDFRSHTDLNRFVAEPRSETNEPEIRRLWQIATSLHQNFYEAWLPAETVKESVADIQRFQEILTRLI